MRIIATGNAGQSMSGDTMRADGATCAGGVTATGLSACFATLAFLRARRGMALALEAFFTGFLGRGFLAFRISFRHR
jgi:hypothetical protein